MCCFVVTFAFQVGYRIILTTVFFRLNVKLLFLILPMVQ